MCEEDGISSFWQPGADRQRGKSPTPFASPVSARLGVGMARILIIDDNEQLRAFCREVLEAEGHVVDDAPDGDVGVQMFNQHPSDLVLCDIFMPNKDGIETIQELTAQYFGVKIIAISGGS